MSYQIPFGCVSGDHLSYVLYHHQDIEWRDNEPFAAVLILEHAQRGRSAANFIWSDTNGHTYTMFLTEMVELVKAWGVSYGKTPLLWWKFVKRGKNYGIKLHGPTK